MGVAFFNLVTIGSPDPLSGSRPESRSPSPSPLPSLTDESTEKVCQNGHTKTKGADLPFEPLSLQVYRSEVPLPRWAPVPDDEIPMDHGLAQDNSHAIFVDGSDVDRFSLRRHDRRLVMPMLDHPVDRLQRAVNALAVFVVSLEDIGTNQPEWPRIQADGSVENEVIDDFLTSIRRIRESPFVPYGAANNPFATAAQHMEYVRERGQRFEEYDQWIQDIHMSLPENLPIDREQGVESYVRLYSRMVTIFTYWVTETLMQMQTRGPYW